MAFELFAAGGNLGGELGVDPEIRQKSDLFRKVPLANVSSLASGGMHVAALSQGRVFTWGVNDDGALGRDGDEFEPAAVRLETDAVPVQVACSDSSTWILNKNGQVWGAGTFRNAQGDKSFLGAEVQRTFTAYPGLPKIVSICAGNQHVLALDEDHGVWVWGVAERELLGYAFARKANTTRPHRLYLNTGRAHASQIFASATRSFVVLSNGKVRTWGLNSLGELGLGHTNAVLRPTLLRPKPFRSAVVKVVGGEFHQLLLLANGQVWGAGTGQDGQMGPSAGGSTFGRIAVPPMSNLSSASRHTMWVDRQGGWWASGDNSSGQLGLGADAESTVLDLSSVVTKTPRTPALLASGGQTNFAAW